MKLKYMLCFCQEKYVFRGKSFCLIMCSCTGKKQDLWYVVDLLTGEKQQTLTSSFAEMLCPSSSLLYLGRTGKNNHKRHYFSARSSFQNHLYCKVGLHIQGIFFGIQVYKNGT